MSLHPAEFTAAYEVQMEVKNHLTSIRIDVKNRAVTFFGNPELLRKLASRCKDVSENRGVLFRDIVQRRDVFARAEEYVNRRLGLDVMKCEDLIVFVSDLGWQFLLRDAAEKT